MFVYNIEKNKALNEQMLTEVTQKTDKMKEKILQEALEWYENQEKTSEINIEDFVNLIINRTADAIFDEVKTELNNEFQNGTLKHPFVISSDYYLELKLKEIRDKCIKTTGSNISSVDPLNSRRK